MKIIDLTQDYINHVCDSKDFDTYEKSCPELFKHYYKFWSKKNYTKIINKTEIKSSSDLIHSVLPKIESQFLNHKIDLSEMTIILFVGMGNTNGHAFKYNNKFVVWIPVETYLNEIDTRIFITHEITHALHFTNTPKFYFENRGEQKHIARQLITEGLATYFSKIILDTTTQKALWGAYLDKNALDKWMISCDENYDKIKKLLKNNFESTDDSLGIFYASDNNDILNFRAGYYAGFKLIEQIQNIHNYSLTELLQLPREKFIHEVYSLIE